MIWMFLDWFKANEVVKEDFKIVKNTMELVYSMIFQLITPHIDLSMKKAWAFFSRGYLGFLSKGSLEDDRQSLNLNL